MQPKIILNSFIASYLLDSQINRYPIKTGFKLACLHSLNILIIMVEINWLQPYFQAEYLLEDGSIALVDRLVAFLKGLVLVPTLMVSHYFFATLYIAAYERRIIRPAKVDWIPIGLWLGILTSAFLLALVVLFNLASAVAIQHQQTLLELLFVTGLDDEGEWILSERAEQWLSHANSIHFLMLISIIMGGFTQAMIVKNNLYKKYVLWYKTALAKAEEVLKLQKQATIAEKACQQVQTLMTAEKNRCSKALQEAAYSGIHWAHNLHFEFVHGRQTTLITDDPYEQLQIIDNIPAIGDVELFEEKLNEARQAIDDIHFIPTHTAPLTLL